MTTIFASDFHGKLEFIDKIKEMIDKYPDAELVFGGDYIDGGHHSKEVLNFIRKEQKTDNAKILLGNHEDMLLDFIKIQGDDQNNIWFLNGAKTTIKSLFGRGFSKKMSYHMLLNYELDDGTNLSDWISSFDTVYENDDAVFVHAFLDVNVSDDIQKVIKKTNHTDKLWNRGFAEHPDIFINNTSKSIVFGHTPTCYFEKDKLKQNQFKTYKHSINTLQEYRCPIYETNNGLHHLIACDGGCHGNSKHNTGNIVVVKNNEIIDWMN